MTTIHCYEAQQATRIKGIFIEAYIDLVSRGSMQIFDEGVAGEQQQIQGSKEGQRKQ